MQPHFKTRARLVPQDRDSERVLAANQMCGGTIRMDAHAEFVYKLEHTTPLVKSRQPSVQSSLY